MSVKVSVCIPVYGVEKYIEKCARSLFGQTMQDGMEFIFVNDCTKDKSIEILENVLAEYPHRKDQVKIINLPENRGISVVRRIAVENCSGEYIIHCDSDDFVELEMYEKMYDAAKEADADMVYCDFICDYEKKRSRIQHNRTSLSPDGHICAIASQKIFGALWFRMYKAEIAQKDYSQYCLEDIIISEDTSRNCCMLQHCKKIVHVQQVFYHYLIRQNSALRSVNEQHYKSHFNAVKILENILKTPEQKKALAPRRRNALVAALKADLLPVREWHSLWKSAKFGMWMDKQFSLKAKILFYLACVNYPLASRLYRRIKS